jgi:hypothetical protein
MYNLFVAYDPAAWNGQPHEYRHEHVLTGNYTADPLRAKYGTLNDTTVQALQSFPALFVNEKQHGLPARIGWITRVRHRGGEVRIEYDIDPLLPEIPMDSLLTLQGELDFSEWELNNSHWALKDADLFPALMEVGLLDVDQVQAQPASSRIKTIGLSQPAPDIEARPSVFRVPTEARDNNLVSVMMPFTPAFDQVYATIQNAATVANLKCERADNIWEAEEVIQDIFSLIYRSGIVVCDFTDQNPNVFYEAGIAHTLGRSLVPISQNEKDVPFDLKHHRYLRYLANAEGLNNLFVRLAPRLNTLRKRLPP